MGRRCYTATHQWLIDSAPASRSMSNEQNPYLPPTTVSAKPVVKNTLPRLIGVALYPVAAVPGIIFVAACVAPMIAMFISDGAYAFEIFWRDPTPLVIWAVLFCITAALIWLARFLRRDRSETRDAPGGDCASTSSAHVR